ncbi:MAG: hypothetical protein FWC70_05625 [Defluviitaleaceae bacterium]|nr:hypothetical protein [Defluviitaleaceae bacterium]
MKLYDTKAISRVLNLSERRVRQLKDKGIISEYKAGTGLYDLIQTNHRYIDYLRNRNPDSEQAADYLTERALLVRAKRRDAEYDLAVKERELHAASDVMAVMSGMLTTFKARILAIPAKLSPILSKKTGKREIFRILKDSMEEALAELSDYGQAFGGEREDESYESGNA